MTNAEENKYSMYEATEAVLEKYLATVEQLPAFAESRSSLTGKIAEIAQTDNAYTIVCGNRCAA